MHPIYDIKSSGLLTTSAAIKATSGRIVGIDLLGGSDASSLTLYDYGSAGGTVMAKLQCIATDSKHINTDIPCAVAIYAGLTGTGAKFVVRYL